MEFYPQRLMVAVPVRAAAAGFSDNTVLPENVRKWIAGINASSPFSDSAVNVHAVAVEEIGCTEQFDSFIGQTVISGDAMVNRVFVSGRSSILPGT